MQVKCIEGVRWVSKGDRMWNGTLLGEKAEVWYVRAGYDYGVDPGWYYYGGGVFGAFLARRRDEALKFATDRLYATYERTLLVSLVEEADEKQTSEKRTATT